MTIRVNIGEAKTRFSELCAAALRGEDVIVQNAGVPKLRLVPVENGNAAKTPAEIAKMRVANIGKWKKEFQGFDLSLAALKADRGDPEERFRRKFGTDL